MIEGLGIPYMGSKRKLAPKILNKIINDNPGTKNIYDLFGGGGSISMMALQYPKIENVFYNEFNTSITLLLEDIRDNGVSDKYYDWIERDTFKENVGEDTLLGGICKCIWSFGNSQRAYLFGKEIEDDKKLLHKIIVNQCEKSLKEFNDKFDVNINLDYEPCLFGYEESINSRRLRIQKMIQNSVNYQNIDKIKRICRLEESGGVSNISQQLEQLQQLERLQLSSLSITNLSYEEVEIKTPIDETIIYLDPPYKNTASYNKTIDFDKLKEYIENSKYTIYVSGYENTYDMFEVASYKHRSTLSATANNEVEEKLYCNRI